MTQEEIISMAREAGLQHHAPLYPSFKSALERFANLVAEATKEKAAKVCEDGWKEGLGARFQGDVFAAAIRAMK
jgi:hypothetical protein